MMLAFMPDGFAVDCNPRCYAFLQTSRSSEIDGIRFKLDAPSIYVDEGSRGCKDKASSGGWLISNRQPDESGPEWIEAGVTSGFTMNVGCDSTLSAYYALNAVDRRGPLYQEFLIPNGRVDPGNDIVVEIADRYADNTRLEAIVRTAGHPTSAPVLATSLDLRNVYYADFGIEGTVSATDKYSSIPMGKFTKIEILRGESWGGLPSSASVNTPDRREGYMARQCADGSFIAGTVTSIDCSVKVAENAPPPVPPVKTVRVTNNAPVSIQVDGTDPDNDYLAFALTKFPANGEINPSTLGQRLVNTDGDSATFMYTPSNTPTRSDTLRYSVSDGRLGHTKEGFISIVGLAPAVSVPDPIDDFAFRLSGNTIHFSWSHPEDGGSDITHYEVERSRDTVRWQHHRSYSETTTDFTYEKSEGYREYFRIFAHNEHGQSAPSNIIRALITDTSPPVIEIRKPTEGQVFKGPNVHLDVRVREPEHTGIEDIRILVDGVPARVNPVKTLDRPYLVDFTADLRGLANGTRTIAVSASNEDGYTATRSVMATVYMPAPKTIDSFRDDFENGMGNWLLTGEDDELWESRSPSRSVVPGSSPGNMVAGSENCDSICTMMMKNQVDLSSMDDPTLRFQRYVATGADISNKEGIVAYVSDDGGRTWSVLGSFTADLSEDDGRWHQEEYDLGAYSSSTKFKLRFDGVSTSSSEDAEIDNVVIFDLSGDRTPPVITLDGANPQVIEAGTGYEELGASTDDGSPVTIDASAFVDEPGSYSVTYDSTDVVGNKAIRVTRIVTVVDTTPPSVTAPPDLSVEASGPLTVVPLGLPSVSDADPSPDVSNDAPTAFPVGNTTVEWIAVDWSGNNGTDDQMVSVLDTTPPSFFVLLPPGIHVASSPLGSPVAFLPPLVIDTVDPAVEVTSTHASGSVFPVGSTVVTFTATDDSGNMATHNITITVVYRPLTLSALPDVRMAYTETRALSVESSDPDGSPVTLVLSPAPGFATIQQNGDAWTITLEPTRSDIGSHVVTIEASAGAKSNSTSFAVEVYDPDLAPEIAAPADVTKEATGPLTPADLGEPDVTDDRDPSPRVSNDAPTAFPVGTTPVVWTATDSAGNSASAVQYVTIQDTTNPEFSILPSSPVIASGPAGGVVVEFGVPSAFDTADPQVNVTSSHEPGSTFPVGTTVVTFTATDDSGNDATHSIAVIVDLETGFQTITDLFSSPDAWSQTFPPLREPSLQVNNYVFETDHESGNPAPSLRLSGDGDDTRMGIFRTVDLGALGDDDLYVNVDLKASNTLLANPDGSLQEPFYYSAALQVYDSGRSVYTGTAGSVPDNREWKSVGANVADMLLGDDEVIVAIWTQDFREEDDRLVVHIDNFYMGTNPPPAPDLFSGGSEAAGAEQRAAPRVDSIMIHVAGDDPAYHEAGAEYVDAGAECSMGSRIWLADADTDVDAGSVGTYRVEYSCEGSTETRAVHVVDTTAPSIYLAKSVSEHPYGAPYEDPGAICSDNHDPERIVHAPGAVDPRSPGPQALRYTCVDASGNEADPKTRIVMVLDPWEEPRKESKEQAPAPDAASGSAEPRDSGAKTAPPVVEASAVTPKVGSPPADSTRAGNGTFSAPPDITAEATGPLTALDLGRPSVPLDHDVYNDAPGAFPVGDTVVGWVTTGSGNFTHVANQTVTITDTTPPEISGVPPRSPATTASNGTYPVIFEMPTAYDLVDGNVGVSASHDPYAHLPIGNTTVVFTASDSSGNVSTYSIIIMVEPSSAQDDQGADNMDRDGP
ncbi:MAG: HYR domain-containing protein [Gammaproteobacteria bacterium]|nr:HYR domain-containing protein [Gammaproteobacteria bacterium]